MAYQFVLIINGEDAPAPAPRCDAVSSESGVGVYVPATGDIVRPDYGSLRAALPAKLRRYAGQSPSAWYRKGTRFGGGRTAPTLPYIDLCKACGAHVATVYLALVEG